MCSQKCLVLGLLLVASVLFGASANFSGTFRTRANYFDKTNLGQADTNSTKTFIDGRALLYPSLLVDDHFSIKTQWSLLTSPNFAPSQEVGGLGNSGQGGWVYGDPNTAKMALDRAWMEWTSDFGVFRLGRVPVAWGYGLIWDAGNGTWDDWQSTVDRLEYRLHFGHVVSTLAYSKPRKVSLMGSENDSEYYTVALKYENPELDIEFGGLYEKQSRSLSQQSALLWEGNPYLLPEGNRVRPYPLHSELAYPLSNSVLDFYMKKTAGYFTFGGELSWLSGNASDYRGSGVQELNAWGLLFSSAYEIHKLKAFVEFLYASGDSDMSSGPMNGFALLHRNRGAGLLLGRQLLGRYYGDNINLGSMVVYGNDRSFSGVYYLRPGVRLDWSRTWSSGIELIYADKAATQEGEEKHLGFEIDLGTDYSVYRNFDVGVTLALLFPGAGLGATETPTTFGFQTTFGLKF